MSRSRGYIGNTSNGFFAPLTMTSLTPLTVTPTPFATVEATRQPEPPAKVEAFAELMNITGDSATEKDIRIFKNFE
ncbi:hypothetical protein LZ086_07660 [Acinetobacter johnsonii]|nr:hypothetical protein LZ086_07660 [Acinetobacter johnsonii]